MVPRVIKPTQNNGEGSNAYGALRFLKCQRMHSRSHCRSSDDLVKRITIHVDELPASAADKILALPTKHMSTR